MTDKQKLAEERTDWAEDRTIMANERTFASWVGAGMGAIGVALAFKAIFGEFQPTWLAKSVSTVPLAAAIVLFWGAERKASGTLKRLTERDVAATGHKTLKVIAILLSLTAFGTAYILWLL
jgi:putative membrane protein